MFYKTPAVKQKIKNICYLIFNKIENNFNIDFKTNGEMLLVDNIIRIFKNEPLKKRIIFDVGANIGQYSEMLIERFKDQKIHYDLHLFEPNNNCFGILKNKFTEKNTTLNNFGVSNTNKSGYLYYNDKTSSLGSLYERDLKYYKIILNKREKIQLKRLDKYIEEKTIDHIHFIKIDVEGNEENTLIGLSQYLNSDFIDFIQFEYGGAYLDSNTNLIKTFNIMTEKGFTVAKIMKKGLEIRKYAPYMENFCYSNYVAISNEVIESC